MKLTHPGAGRTIEVADSVADRYLSQGWSPATAGAPKGNAGLAEWQEFARAQGMSDEDLEGQSRDDLRAALS
ncbi:hypothetical protein [Nocardioides alcanivorans]|uniref:hypothetical protein n=1 Tax=Nocardioides alcanivorans TaxID=2897352 RepID=UPI001F303A4E|nr:hypothetical protein [Nocardioides alcanivorans]